jgi:hypothetical protein
MWMQPGTIWVAFAQSNNHCVINGKAYNHMHHSANNQRSPTQCDGLKFGQVDRVQRQNTVAIYRNSNTALQPMEIQMTIRPMAEPPFALEDLRAANPDIFRIHRWSVEN